MLPEQAISPGEYRVYTGPGAVLIDAATPRLVHIGLTTDTKHMGPDGRANLEITSQQARDLAAALIAHADHADRRRHCESCGQEIP